MLQIACHFVMSERVLIEKDELIEFRHMLRKMLSQATYGILYRQGWIIGKNITKNIDVDENYFDKVAEILKERGWVESIELGGEEVVVKGSIEAQSDGSGENMCHMLRGILASIYQKVNAREVNVIELLCAANGGDKCVFFIDLGNPEIDLRKKLNRIKELVSIARDMEIDVSEITPIMKEASEFLKKEDFEHSAAKLDTAEKMVKSKIEEFSQLFLKSCERIIERNDYAKGLYLKAKRMLENEEYRNLAATVKLLRDLIDKEM